MKLSKYISMFFPWREMVKIMEANEKEEYFSAQHKEYLNKWRMAQNDILEIFISEFKWGVTLHIWSTANTSKGYTFIH